MQDYSIERLGEPNLDFTGEVIGQSGGVQPRIKIYRTKGGKYVGESRFGPQLANANAQNYDSPALLVNWFKSMFGSVTTELQGAIEDATKHDDSFKSFWNVRVE